MDIEIRNKIIPDGYRERTIKFLVIDGVVDEDSYVSDDEAPDTYARLSDENALKELKSYSINEINSVFSCITFDLNIASWNESISIHLNNRENEKQKPFIQFDLGISQLEHWAKLWSITSFAEQIEFNVHAYANQDLEYWDHRNSLVEGFGINCYISDSSLTLEEVFQNSLSTFTDIFDKANKFLLASLDQDSVLTYFQFPEEIKTACKQYLVYFAQFIADLGIEVDSEIKDELNHILFKITPKDKTESLERIQKVLTLYLDAPTDTSFQNELAKENEIAAKQWEANIYHLKSQLSLATSIIQAKEATIESLQLSNYQYRQLVDDHSKKEADKEELVKGVLAVEKYEGNGFSINLAEILRRLKRIGKK